MKFDHAMAQFPGQRHGVHASHGDMAGIQHQSDIFGLGVLHDVHGLMLILDLASQMGMDAKLHAQLFADTAAQQIQRDGDLFEVVDRRAIRLLARAGIGLLVIAAEAAREARHVEMIVHDCLTLGRIMEGDAAAQRAARDGGELAADLIHAVLQGFPAVGIIDLTLGARAFRIFPAIAAGPDLHGLRVMGSGLKPVRRGTKGGAEDFEIAEAHVARFADADEGAAFPAAAGVGGIADAKLLLLGRGSCTSVLGAAV